MDDTRTLRVQQKRWEADGITSVTLVDPTGAALPAWEPGAHVALHLPNGLVREYSLCSDPADSTQWTVAVLRTVDSRGGSTHVHDALPVGALIGVDGPRNNFPLDEDATDHVLVAGGIGITPMISMVRRLESAGKPWQLIYLGRSTTTMAFVDEVAALPAERVTMHVLDENAGAQLDLGQALGGLGPDTLVYACGPESLMTACGDALAHPDRLRIERFRAPEVVTAPGDDMTFDVVVSSTGERITVDENTSVLDALTGAGLPVESSCTEGICGTCEVGVIKGDVDHRDFVLSDDEHDAGLTMLPCVSRCRSAELVLDL
ncbi:PDR/VanB family oxidoreductase [Gordonia sp. CPCC 206044]|uniref:PDR/VanB family oxidoreductase n=1 Tax=Gordonia sp. CPCC 206044 TaxID=3140793 RepID=UPI003AF38493